MTSSATALEVENLNVYARGSRGTEPLQLVEDVDFRVSVGGVLGVVGETGAGKTMTIRATLGLLPRGVFAEGSIRLGDDHVAVSSDRTLGPYLGRSTGIVLQNPFDMLDPLMRTGGQMAEGVLRAGLMSKREARDRASHLLSMMGFDDPSRVLSLYPSELSGGMAQRVSIALALMPGPLVVAVDEPTSALDAQSRLEVLGLIRTLCAAEGTAVIFVSHDLDLVGRVCEEVAVMYAGRVIEHGNTATVMGHPTHPYTKSLMNCVPTVESPPRAPMPVIPGSPPPPGSWPGGCRFEPRCPHASDRAVSERPELRPVLGRDVACHRAEELVGEVV